MTRRIWAIEGNGQRLDGGAMFGNAPKAVWRRWIEPDELNRIPLACRALLVQEPSGRRVLFEAGVGVFFAPKLRARFGIEPEHALLNNLAAIGVTPEDIDVVVLSHLHFDHAGGLLDAWQADTDRRLVFTKARYVVGAEAWQRATLPHARDRASFIPELPGLLTGTGRLEIISGDTSETLGPDYRFHHSEGHTPGQLLTELPSAEGPIVFAGDLVPGRPWMHLPITMGYDRFPERLIEEKTALLADLLVRGGRLFFPHDPQVALVRVARDAKGRYTPGEAWPKPEGMAI